MHAWRRELRALLSIGIPMGLTQLIQFSIHTIDVIMIGKLGPAQLAGASLGMVFFFVLFLAGMGPAQAVAPLIAQAIGRDPNDMLDVRRSVRMGLWVVGANHDAALFGISLHLPRSHLAWASQVKWPTSRKPYALALAPGLPFCIRGRCAAQLARRVEHCACATCDHRGHHFSQYLVELSPHLWRFWISAPRAGRCWDRIFAVTRFGLRLVGIDLRGISEQPSIPVI